MAKVALMALGQLIGSDIKKSISELAKLSARDSWLPIYPAHWVMTACKLQYDTWFGGNIAKYKKGEMTTPEFIQFLKDKISTKATDQEIKAAWNAMCEVSYNSRSFGVFRALADNSDIHLAVIGVTNELHYNYITEQFKKHITHFESLISDQRVKIVNSFQEKTLEVNLLVSKALAGFDETVNTIFTFIHTAAAIPSMAIGKARIEMCRFDPNKTFSRMLDVQSNAHQKSL